MNRTLPIFALACTLLVFIGSAIINFYELLIFALPASLLTAGVLWRRLMTGKESNLLRGALVGLLTALVTQGVTIVLLVLSEIIFSPFPTNNSTVWWNLLDVFEYGLLLALVLTMGSLLLLSPITLPSGALIGFLVAYYEKRHLSSL